MPIDEALSKIEDREKPESVDKIVSDNESLVVKARDIMGNVLIDYFKGDLPGQGNKYKVDDTLLPIIKKVGLQLFEIKPELRNDNRLLTTDFNKDLDQNTLNEMATLMLGEYSLETDLTSLFKTDNLETLCSIIPEFRIMKNKLIAVDDMKKIYLATMHPYIVVMGMPTEHRALAILAVDKAISSNRITLLDHPLDDSLSHDFIFNKLDKIKPFARDYVEVAKDYNIKDVLRTIKDFNAVCESYLKEWSVKWQ